MGLQEAHQVELGLAAVLTADDNGTFDNSWYDHDIVTEAILGVLAAKPASNVKLLTDGSVALPATTGSDVTARSGRGKCAEGVDSRERWVSGLLKIAASGPFVIGR